ncbi:unnamed protein product [Rangifer tarandus platyrhynchus]|uniref:Uncharacterized protein n=1 Tax=Rangifer tarandus platyrhynchus TaxID=3082113 RepID=A0ABN8ZHG8_RANTA|nr:unnamed protein product [Rangifer tarandus platyrhynchus]
MRVLRPLGAESPIQGQERLGVSRPLLRLQSPATWKVGKGSFPGLRFLQSWNRCQEPKDKGPGTVLGAADRSDLVPGAAELRVSWENQMLMKQKRRCFTNCGEHDEGKGMASSESGRDGAGGSPEQGPK